ncbi:MAG TPA: sigma-70 family RNA polymerase sigma factor [Solirubrobacterales bacterium]|jgi:RNA polymerase sigma factor (sigma-70 family)|nr:sigma-70 family RNA polymerase sigma factor [Solirubrobacterales bacterium]
MPPPADGFAARFVLGPALRTQPDRRLVALVREGYELAFEEIVRRYGRPLGRYAGAIVGNRADDVTQDAFSKALLALRRDGAEIELRPWLFRIVRNTALNDLRDRPPSAEALAGEIAGGRNPAEELERREELADLMRRLQSLPEPQRAAIVMRELEGLGHEEIAAALGLSGGGARQAIYRARRALREGLGMLLPLPLLKQLLSGTAAVPMEAAAGTAGIGGAAGAGVALKAGAATVLVAGALGAGVAIDHDHRGGGLPVAKAHADVAERSAPSSNDTLRAPDAREASRATSRRDHAESAGRVGGGSGSEAPAGRGDHGDSHGPRGGDRSTHDHAGSGDTHGSQSGSSSQAGGGEHHSGRSTEGSTGSGEERSGSGDGGGEHSGSDDGPASISAGEEPAIGEGSGSNSGPDSGGMGGGDVPDSEHSGDSHDAEGFSVQMEPQPEETR